MLISLDLKHGRPWYLFNELAKAAQSGDSEFRRPCIVSKGKGTEGGEVVSKVLTTWGDFLSNMERNMEKHPT